MNRSDQLSPIEVKCWDQLRKIIDPEVGMNLVDLGLIYDLTVMDNRVNVKMTLTTPGCPMHDMLIEGARASLCLVDGIRSATVQLVWEPPWSPDLILKKSI